MYILWISGFQLRKSIELINKIIPRDATDYTAN
jgi:hypothetical protein